MQRPHPVPGAARFPIRARLGVVAVLAFGWLTSTGAVGGCRMFRPAAPEPPTGSAIQTDYRTPDLTLETMALGLADKGRTNGLAAYIGGLADTASDGRGFHAFFDAAVAQSFKDLGRQVPTDWNLSLEQRYYTNFASSRPEPFQMQWIVDETLPDVVEADAATLHRQYRVFVELPDGNTALIAIGFCDLDFIRSPQSRWVIVRWQDKVDPAVGANPSDTDLRTLGWRRLENQ